MRSILLSTLILLSLCLVGCADSGPKVAPVKGTVRINGQTYPGVCINFVPGTTRGSTGVTDENGRYSLDFTRDRKGALVGNHKVSVVLVNFTSGSEFEIHQEDSVEVPSGGLTKDFELTIDAKQLDKAFPKDKNLKPFGS